ncbi:hypothetical protein [Ruegeria arenilitoris]|uniref:hypothetical protein n=1 Tax=Ruegeria arenilitoris TaxID=1173585 RepID=UPI00147C39C9|nr:hypothetical protein [Ruegeria arenilitoris]
MANTRTPSTVESLWSALGDEPISWPDEVEPWTENPQQAEALFQSILAGRPRARWGDSVDIRLAAILARTIAHHEFCYRMAEADGFIVQNEKGATVRSPWLSLHINLSSLIVAQQKQLGIVARPGNNKVADDNKAQGESAARKLGQKTDNSPLLA